jgi:hypothetical protein
VLDFVEIVHHNDWNCFSDGLEQKGMKEIQEIAMTEAKAS